MNFVCIVFEIGDKMLTLLSMENLIVQCNLKNLLSRNHSQILMKLCMKHQKPKPFIICANNNPGLTLTYLMAIY